MAHFLYKVNHKYFDNLTSESAYFLGLLAADGNVDKSKRRITLSFCQKDADLLEKFKFALSSTHPIKRMFMKCKGKTYPQSVFRFSSPYMCQTLSKYGIVPHKSLSLNFPDIPWKFIPAFIRGYFDGDGSVTITKSKNIFITILGTQPLLRKMKQYYNEACNTTTGWIGQHNKSQIFHFCIHGNPCGLAFSKWIYEDSTSHTRLKRKYDKLVIP